MAITTGHITVTTTRVQIDGQSPNPSVLHISNDDNTQTLYIGDGNVTTSNGLRLEKLERIVITLNPGESLYAISSIGAHSISWLRQTMY